MSCYRWQKSTWQNKLIGILSDIKYKYQLYVLLQPQKTRSVRLLRIFLAFYVLPVWVKFSVAIFEQAFCDAPEKSRRTAEGGLPPASFYRYERKGLDMKRRVRRKTVFSIRCTIPTDIFRKYSIIVKKINSRENTNNLVFLITTLYPVTKYSLSSSDRKSCICVSP
jgi:hypothetical protein